MTDKHSTDKDKEIENINPKPEWEQIEVVHCPDISCSVIVVCLRSVESVASRILLYVASFTQGASNSL